MVSFKSRAEKKSIGYRIFSGFLVCSFVFTSVVTPSYAQVLPALPAPGSMVTLSPAYTPAIMQGLTVNPQNPLEFNFIIDAGDDNLQGEAFREESNKLIKYFLASLTVNEKDMWVNLSPYEKNRIIPDSLGQTELGRDMLAQDYLLKQLSASLMYPEDELGQKFWNDVRSKVKAKFGDVEIPTNTFNKIWIVPQNALIYQNETTVVVLESHLKVLLEQDYLALESNKNSDKHGIGSVNENEMDLITGVTAQAVREVLIPAIEQEVNSGKNFANLRQIYNSMILATWYKENLKAGLLGQVYVNQNKVLGVDVEDKNIKDKIYEQYVEAFKQGVYDYIKEDYDVASQQVIPRQYFSGGLEGVDRASISAVQPTEEHVARLASRDLKDVGVQLGRVNNSDRASLAEIEPVDVVLGKNKATKTSYRETHGVVVNDLSLRVLNKVAGLSEEEDDLNAKRNEYLMQRIENGQTVTFPNPAAYIPGTKTRWRDARAGKFRTDPVPADYEDRRSELTGPATIKPTEIFNPAKDGTMAKYLEANLAKDFGTITYQLLSRAKTMMFDGEDALGSKLSMSLDNIQALAIAFDALDNEQSPYYDLFWKTAEAQFKKMVQSGYHKADFDWKAALKNIDTKRMFRHRGLHLKSREFQFVNSKGEREAVSATIADIVMYVTNVYQTFQRQGSTIKLYSPKLQTAEEAAWLKKVFNAIEDELGLRRGTIKTTVLIEQIQEAYEIEGIRAALGENFAGFNTGRWDYIADVVKQMYGVKNWIAPNFTQMTMLYEYMAAYEKRVLQAVNIPGRIVARDQYLRYSGISESALDELIKKGYFSSYGKSEEPQPVDLLYVEDKYLALKSPQDLADVALTETEKRRMYEALTVHWIGGMEANIPTVQTNLDYPDFPGGLPAEVAREIEQGQINLAIQGKIGEQNRGASGYWMAHWKMGKPLFEGATVPFYAKPEMAGRVNQLGMKVEPMKYDKEAAAKLIELREPKIRTKAEFKKLVAIMIYNLNAELTGRAAVAAKAVDDFLKPRVGWLMDDRATTEGRGKLVRDWVKKNAAFTDEQGNETGEFATEELFLEVAQEMLQKLKDDKTGNVIESSKTNELETAYHIATKFVTNDDALPLPWTVDLVNIALDWDTPEQAKAQVDKYIQAFNESRGRVRLRENPHFEADEVVTADRASLPSFVAEDIDRRIAEAKIKLAEEEATGLKWDQSLTQVAEDSLRLIGRRSPTEWRRTIAELEALKFNPADAKEQMAIQVKAELERARKALAEEEATGLVWDQTMTQELEYVLRNFGRKSSTEWRRAIARLEEQLRELTVQGQEDSDRASLRMGEAYASFRTTLAQRTRELQEKRNRRRFVHGRFLKEPHTAGQIVPTTAPDENILKITEDVGDKYNYDQRRNFRDGTTSGTFGVTNQVEAEAAARAVKIQRDIILQDVHLFEILGLDAEADEVQRLKADLIANGYINANGKITDEFINLDPRNMKLSGKYGASLPEIYLGLVRVFWKRIQSIYQGGWAEIMKYFGASDQAKEEMTYLSREPEELSTLLIRHARHQEAAISMMNLNEVDEEFFRVSPKFVDFYIPIVMDIDHGHGKPHQIIRTNLTVGKDGLLVAAVHLEDQCIKKCGHMPRKSLVSTKDWLEALSAVRQELDALGLTSVSIVFRTDAEDAHIIAGINDGRDQEFLYGATNFVNKETLEAYRASAAAKIRTQMEKKVKDGEIVSSNLEQLVADGVATINGIIDSMIDNNGWLMDYEAVIEDARENESLDDESLEQVDAIWKDLSGRITIGKLVERELVAQGENAKMTVEEWRAFLQSIPREFSIPQNRRGEFYGARKFLDAVKLKAKNDLGIVIHTKESFQQLQNRPDELNDGNRHVMWDLESTRIHEDRYDFYMVESGLPMAISRNSYALAYGDNPWMEQKKANILEIMLWSMALDQRAIDILIEEDYWGLLESLGEDFKKENGGRIVEILRTYLLNRISSPSDSFVAVRSDLESLGIPRETAIHLINSVSRPKANNTSPSFRWPFAKVGITKKKLQKTIDEIMVFLPSFKNVATNPDDVVKIWERVHASLGLEAGQVVFETEKDLRSMTDTERKNFLSVQGRFSQKQFSTYFGEVKNHVLSQLFLEGYNRADANNEAQKVLNEVFKDGFLTDEMYVVSKLQELGYAIDNAFTANSQEFAGVVYDTIREAVGKGGRVLFKAYGGASDTQGKSVRELRKEADKASLSEDPVGGIDLNAENLDLQTQGTGSFNFTIDNPDLNNLKIDGFVPVIINVTPITNLPLLLGMGKDAKDVDIGYQTDRDVEELSYLN